MKKNHFEGAFSNFRAELWKRSTSKARLDRALMFAHSSLCHGGMDQQRQDGALLSAVCIVAAIRPRGEPIRPSPKLTATIVDSVQLASPQKPATWQKMADRSRLEWGILLAFQYGSSSYARHQPFARQWR